MNYFVTGTAGFIGSNIAKALTKNNAHVIGIDNLNNYYDIQLKQKRLQELLPLKNFTFIEGDIENHDLLKSIFKKHAFSAVFNLAARAGVRYSRINPHIYFSTNALGNLNLLECLRQFNVPKYILASTSSLYAGHNLPFQEDSPVNNPISPYAASKKSAEVLSYTYHKLYNIDVSILRYFTVYGPSGRPDMSVFRFIQSALNQNVIPIYGDGNQARDFTYIDDIVAGTLQATKNLGYSIINLGSGMKNPISINETLAIIESTLKRSIPRQQHTPDKSDMLHTQADISKAQKILGWKPQVPFQEGLQKTIDWHLENDSWLKNIKI